jgi:hypothetical protein
MRVRFFSKFTALLLGLFAIHAPAVWGSDLVPGVQGHYSQTIENYPKPENQYPEGDSMGRLSTGNIGNLPINLAIVLKYDIESVSELFKAATLELQPFYTNPNPSNPDAEGNTNPSVEHFYVVEVFGSENEGPITFDDVFSDDVKRVGPVLIVSRGVTGATNPEPHTVDVTEALRAAKKNGWKSLAFRIVETDEQGEPLELPENTLFGIQFLADPVLQID